MDSSKKAILLPRQVAVGGSLSLAIEQQSWKNAWQLKRRTYQCGYCNITTGSIQGYTTDHLPGGEIYICGGCNQPTYFYDNNQVPPPTLGNSVTKLPTQISILYEEARKCTGFEAYTACVILCRKILMHIAVDQGASNKLNFLQCVDYLDEKRFIPTNGKIWVDHIRKKSNEANHQIVIMSKQDADRLLTFLEILLRLVYEFPNLMEQQET